MKLLALTLTLLAVVIVTDVAFARGVGYSGGGGVSGGSSGHHGGGGYTGGGHAAGQGGVGHGGTYAYRWHGGGWHGAGVAIYLGNLANWGAWPRPYYGTYPDYYPYPAATWDAETTYGEPEQQVAPAPTWDVATVYVEPEEQEAPEAEYYWYYCTDPAGYYPYVQNCYDAWIAVVPQR